MPNEEQTSQRGRFKWWHGVLFYAGVQVAELGIRLATRRMIRSTRKETNREFYREQRLPVFAPPGIAFPIAWTINSASSIAGALHVFNLQRDDPERRRFLGFQAAAWLLFAVFTTAYFELHSPINGAAVTLGFSCVTAASIRAAVRMKDWRAALSLLPTAAWLGLANPLAVTVAAWNRDEFWGVGPFVDPPKFLAE